MSEEIIKNTTSDLVKKVPNPEGKGGFQERPQDINRSGTWNPTMVFSFQYRRFLGMAKDEFDNWIENNPERTVVEDAAWSAVKEAKTSLGNRVEITDRTEGKSPQTVVVDGGFFSKDKLQVEIIKTETDTIDNEIQADIID